MNVSFVRGFAVLALLACAPCVQAVSITQTHSFSDFQLGFSNNASASFTWFFAPAEVGVTSVDFIGHFTSTATGGVNVFITSSSVFTQPPPAVTPPFPIGWNVNTSSGDVAVSYIDATSLTLFRTPNARFMQSVFASGGFSLTNINLGITGDLSLVYHYADGPAVSAPDAGTTAALLGFACCGLFLAAHRFTGRAPNPCR